MRTILVTGNDTGVGKTWVVGAIARCLAQAGQTVQLIKPVETGVVSGQDGDAENAASFAGNAAVSYWTLRRYTAALAPLTACDAEKTFSIASLVSEIQALPSADWRLVEGAGGIAVPLQEDGADWADFADALGVDGVFVVVENRLGGINQARLSHAYASSRGLRSAVWLNARGETDDAVLASTRAGIIASGIRLAGESKPGERTFEQIDWSWLDHE